MCRCADVSFADVTCEDVPMYNIRCNNMYWQVFFEEPFAQALSGKTVILCQIDDQNGRKIFQIEYRSICHGGIGITQSRKFIFLQFYGKTALARPEVTDVVQARPCTVL